MRNKEIIVLYESNKRNLNGFRKIEIQKYIYDATMKCKKKILKIVENSQQAQQYCLSQGWGNMGYVKDLITGDIRNINS